MQGYKQLGRLSKYISPTQILRANIYSNLIDVERCIAYRKIHASGNVVITASGERIVELRCLSV
jgi:hypothetical protein